MRKVNGRKERKEKTGYRRRKEVNAEFRKGAAFTGGGNAAYQPRMLMSGSRGMVQPGKGRRKRVCRRIRKLLDKKSKKSGQEEKSGFGKENNAFTGQNNFSQPEEMEKKQPDTEDYHRRDTYRQSQEKGKYHKKRVQKEHRGRENTKNSTFAEDVFTENTGNAFQEDGGSDFTGSKKLQKKQRQAQKAGKKVQKARAKLPKTREYTLQRVFDEKTGKGKYVVVPLDKEKPFRQEGIPKTTMRRMRNESRNFVHGKIAETEKENSAVEGAHKSEQKGEELFSFVKRQIKGKGQKQRAKVGKAGKKAL